GCGARRHVRLRRPADKADRGCGSERRPVVVVYLVLQTSVANLVGAGVLVQAVGAPIRQQQAMESHGESGFTEGLNRLRFAQQAGTPGYDYLAAAMRIDRIGDQAVDRCRRTAIETVRQYRIDDRAFQNSMQRAGVVDRIGMPGPL